MRAVAILSPGHPTNPGGVTDHTTRLFYNWQAAGHEVLVVGRCTDQPKKIIAELAASSVHAILIQYVPFLYGRRGLSRFPRQFAIAAREQGMRVTTFVHEPWVPANRPTWLVLSPLQKRQLKRLLAVSDTTVTAVPAWQAQLGENARLLYVGCVQPPTAAETIEEPLLESPVVFSPFAAGLNWEWISRAERDLDQGSGLTIIGADKTAICQHPHVRRFYRPTWDCRGRLPGEEVLNLLGRSRLVLAPFIDGATGRRTSIAAALSVGSRILSSKGHLFDSTFDGPVSIADGLDDFVSHATQLWSTPPQPAERADRLQWFRTFLDPVTLDTTLYQTVTGSGD